ncbi:MAG TPA: tetratricopeptide repeat protein [Tepidisphaeraceae bacterium]|jgi:tetratricopeptide (TPR) repeat protein|nr:tetratricopeptide repeat protein [Tepidisphaeraceae bacterium]
MKLTTAERPSNLAQSIRNRYVTYTGKLATLSHEQFVQIVEDCGARFISGNKLGAGVALIVVGQGRLPINRHGYLTDSLRQARILKREGKARITVLQEEQFLDALGMEPQRQQVSPLLTTTTLCGLLDVSRQRIAAWVQAGLVQPVAEEDGVWHFDFQQIATAKTLSDLTRAGVTVGRIRRSLEQLKAWLPEMNQPLQQVSVLQSTGDLVVRLEDGDFAGINRQLHFNFEGAPEAQSAPLSLRINPDAPQTATQFFDQGIEQEAAGYIEDAAESYRQALRLGGPDAQICFDLASVLHQLGHREQAMERYHQVIEMDGQNADAWNNLGLILCELERYDEGASAFRRALHIDFDHALARYNLADTLEDLGQHREAVQHWEAYLKHDQDSRWASHARHHAGTRTHLPEPAAPPTLSIAR